VAFSCVVSPVDSITRSCLIGVADSYFHGLLWSTLVLFLGAIMEEAKNPFDLLRSYEINLQTGTTVAKIRIRLFRHWYHLAAIIMVVGGIGGEGIFEYLAARAESDVREFDNRSLIVTEKIATAAQNRAGIADRELIRLRTPRFLNLKTGWEGRIRQRLAPFSARILEIRFQSGIFDAEELARRLAPVLGTEGVTPLPEDKAVLESWSFLTPPASFVFGVEMIYRDGWVGQNIPVDLSNSKRLADAIAGALTAEGLDGHVARAKWNAAPDLNGLFAPSGQIQTRTYALRILKTVIVRVGTIPQYSAINQEATASSP